MTAGQRALDVVRAVLYLALTYGVTITALIAASKAGLIRPGVGTLDDPSFLLQGLISLLVALGTTWFMCRLQDISIRDVGFADPDPRTKIGMGFVWGGAIVALVVIIPWVARHETVGGSGAGAAAIAAAGLRQLGAFAPQSAAEEIFVRGYALTHLRRGIGPIPAVFVTGTLFGVLHLINPNSSWVAATTISLVGIFLGALVIRTGSLWMAIGLHISWNWFEGFFFGHPVSGIPPGTSLLLRTSADDSLWTGGAFGPEQSLPTAIVLFGCLVAVLLVRRTKAQ